MLCTISNGASWGFLLHDQAVFVRRDLSPEAIDVEPHCTISSLAAAHPGHPRLIFRFPK